MNSHFVCYVNWEHVKDAWLTSAETAEAAKRWLEEQQGFLYRCVIWWGPWNFSRCITRASGPEFVIIALNYF
jgi:hypothetical protein